MPSSQSTSASNCNVSPPLEIMNASPPLVVMSAAETMINNAHTSDPPDTISGMETDSHTQVTSSTAMQLDHLAQKGLQNPQVNP